MLPAPPPTFDILHEPPDLPDDFAMDLDDRSQVVRLHVAGELDSYTAPRLVDAVKWLRRRHAGGLVLDLHDVTFVDTVGYRAIHHASCDEDGRPDPRVVRVIGPAVAKLELVVALATGR